MRRQLLNALLYVPTRTLDVTPADHGLRYEDVTIDTADGERLHGWWVPATTPSPLGHVLFFHGNAGNIARRVLEAELLVAQGFDVLLFDYRGYGRSTGRPSERGTYEDARAARRALLARAGVRADRVLYMGESLGGAVALALASEIPPAGLILRSTFTNILEMARLRYPLFPRFIVPDAYPSLRRIAALDCPVLIVHGDRDELVPVRHGHALYAAAREPKRLVVLEGIGHNDVLTLAGLRQAQLIAEWAKPLVCI